MALLVWVANETVRNNAVTLEAHSFRREDQTRRTLLTHHCGFVLLATLETTLGTGGAGLLEDSLQEAVGEEEPRFADDASVSFANQKVVLTFDTVPR